MPPRKRAHYDQSNAQRKKRAHSDQSNTQRTKRAHSGESKTQRRTKRTRGSDLPEVSPDVAVAAQTRSNDHNQNLISIDLRALSTSITTTISQAIQQALGTGGTHSLDQDSRASLILPVESDEERSSSRAIQGEITAITQEPSQPLKRIHNLNQWLSAFNTFVAIYVKKYPLEAPKLMKYREVVRDVASKPGDWSFYDEQFRYVRRSASDQYPWDTIHWELWLRAVTNFRARPQVSSDKASTRLRNRQSFLKGTCWAFHAGRFCATSTTFVSNVTHPIPQVNVHLLVCNAPPPSHPGAKLAHPPAQQSGHPVRVNRLDFLLHGYTPAMKQFLVDGFSFDFRIKFMGERRPFESPNLKSAPEQPHIVTAKLDKELAADRIAGPFPSPPFSNFRCSSLGIVPKKDPPEFRLIHHLSYPKGSSVNDHIPEKFSSVRYASISDAISVIKKLGAGCFMAKTDIKSTFRIIPVHPKDHPLLGMKWANQYYYDRALPMGCSSSCAILEAFSSALEWLSKHLFNASGVVHILDDFLFIAPTRDKCQSDLGNFLRMCSYLGVLIAQEKTVRSFNTLQFAGITPASVRQEARLPDDKLRKCQLLLHPFYTRRKPYEAISPGHFSALLMGALLVSSISILSYAVA
ncbi:hypothetical protein AWC38_SpisGene941 [Stylophora pistillata]|uniref:Reverse transcriptase domain-containing protein n=1 Tax=Stylophora pistillata TaxID=50429 RepID=A0A2B4T0H6_STYPI|nr:hypothetical protein AWC38_SpisGene941 [Stylophora pistillata]